MAEQFGRIPAAVVMAGALADLTPTETKVYVVICTFANRRWSARISHKRIGKLAGVTRTRAASATASLVRQGLLHRTKRGGSNAGANTYEVALKCPRMATLGAVEVSPIRVPSVPDSALKCPRMATPSESYQSNSSEEEQKCATHTPEESGKTRRRVPSPPPARPLWEQARELKGGVH